MKDSIEVPAPRDAKGRDVPLDVKVMYDDKGVEYSVRCLIFRNRTEICEAGWAVESVTAENEVRQVSLDRMYIEKPYGLKQLLEDLDRDADAKGSACRAYAADDKACTRPIVRDIAFHIPNLRGEGR